MKNEVYNRRIKAISGNGTGSVKIQITPGKRLHGVGLKATWASGVSTSGDTLIEQVAAITEIRVLVGSTVKRRISGPQLRDYMLLNGAAYDFDAVSTYVAQLYIPFAEEWFIANVADALAWNPLFLGGNITIEVDVAALNTTYFPTFSAYERVSDDLDAASAGIITWEVLTPVSGSPSFFVETPVFNARGRLIQATVYPGAGSLTTAITAVSLFVGPNDVYAHEALDVAENDDLLSRSGLTPRNTSRITYAYNYDLVFVRGDALAHSIDLETWGRCKLKIESSGISGACPIVVARLEGNPFAPAASR